MSNIIKRKKINKSNYDNVAYLFILPNYLIFIIFLLIPIIWTIVMSFTDYNLISYEFVGWDNYLTLFKDKVFIQAFKNTLVYSIFTIPLAMGIGLLLALALNKKCRFKSFFRTIFYMPNVLSVVAISMAWLYMFDGNAGIINRILALFGIGKVQWLTNSSHALLSVCFVGIWFTAGYNMVIFLSGLQSIPEYLYEAAGIDGANAFQKFKNITLPMLSPTTFFIFVMACINSFQVFGQIYILTAGGPSNATTTLAHQVYKNGFELYKMGYASAEAVILMLMILTITVINMVASRGGVEGEE